MRDCFVRRDACRGSATQTPALVPAPKHPPRPDHRPPSLIEIRLVDRETARKNMAAGLVAAGIATGVFALAFIVALFYIAQG